MSLRQFDPNDFLMLYGGHRIDEMAANFFQVNVSEPRYRIVEGVDGDAARVRSLYRGGTITITLMQSAISNEFMSIISLLDEATGLLSLPFLAKEKGRDGVVVFAASTFITKMPDITMSNGFNDRQWVLQSDNIIQFVGGHDLKNGGNGTNDLIGRLTTLPSFPSIPNIPTFPPF